MPKVKTRKTAAKRFKMTARGTLLRRRATRAHKLTSKSGARKRAYTQEHGVHEANLRAVKKMLGVK